MTRQGRQFLNDVAADAQGNVYVSDSNTSTIWRLAGGKFEKWIDGPALKFPNGLHVVGRQADRRRLGCAGHVGPIVGAFEPAVEVSLADKKISDLGDGTPVGNLDGIEPIGDDFLVTDWVAGALYRIDRKGKATQLLDLEQGSADIGYVPGDGPVADPDDDERQARRLQSAIGGRGARQPRTPLILPLLTGRRSDVPSKLLLGFLAKYLHHRADDEITRWRVRGLARRTDPCSRHQRPFFAAQSAAPSWLGAGPSSARTADIESARQTATQAHFQKFIEVPPISVRVTGFRQAVLVTAQVSYHLTTFL